MEKFYQKRSFLIAFLVFMVMIVFATSYFGSVDIGDYSDNAKYFAGEYSAKLRISHSYLYGLMMSPFVYAFESFFFYKVISLLLLFAIIYSCYRISGKDKKSFLLIFFSPFIWYMAPWINPIQLASLFVLWSFFFIERYNQNGKIKELIYSGVLIGLAMSFWNTVIYFAIIMGAVFLFNKKTINLFIFIAAFFIGLAPLLLLDYWLFGFPFYTILKTGFSQMLFIFGGGGIYGSGGGSGIIEKLFGIGLIVITFPVYLWGCYKGEYFKQNKKALIFFALSLLVIFTNPQLRYALALVPIAIVLLARKIDDKRFNRQILISLIISLIIISPYVMQIKYGVEGKAAGVDITELISGDVRFSERFYSQILEEEVNVIARDYPNESFVVGNQPDDYQLLAHYYWGNDIEEFVSIQDYELEMKNESILMEKSFRPVPRIPERRQIFLSGGLMKNFDDRTDYGEIEYAIGVGQEAKIMNFSLIKKYNLLYLSKKN